MPTVTYRAWCFTYYNGEPSPSGHCRYACWQHEIAPDTGRDHVQGYAEFTRPVSIAAAQRHLGLDNTAHLEPRGGTRDQARDYTRKPETAVPDTWREYGTWDGGGQGARTDLAEPVGAISGGARLAAVALAHPVAFVKYHRGLAALRSAVLQQTAPAWRDLLVVTLVGPTGVGKTRWAAGAYPDAYLARFERDRNWWDGYDGESVLIIDEYRGQLPFEFFLGVLDGYRCRLPVKGGHTEARWERVIITSNQAPEDWYIEPYAGGPLERRLEGAGRTLVRKFESTLSIPVGVWREGEGDPAEEVGFA